MVFNFTYRFHNLTQSVIEEMNADNDDNMEMDNNSKYMSLCIYRGE